MIISAASDYRAAAQRILPPFLFHYMDGGAYSEYTLRRNVEDLSEVALRQRILKNMSDLSLESTLFIVWHVCASWRSSGSQSGGRAWYSVYSLDGFRLPD